MGTRWFRDALTLSDSDKLEHVPGSGGRTCRLKLQQSWQDDNFTDFGHLTEVDSGTNVTVDSGVIKFKGAGVWDANGVRTALVSTNNPGAFRARIKMNEKGYCGIGFTRDASGLDYNDEVPKVFFDGSGNLALIEANTITRRCFVNTLCDVGDTFDIWFEWDWDPVYNVFQIFRICIALPDLEDNKFCVFEQLTDNDVANIGFQINCYQAFSTPWELSELEYLDGYDTGGEDGSTVLDAGEGNTWDGSVLATLADDIALPTDDDPRVSYDDVTFDVSYDDGTPDWQTGKTLAQLETWMKALDTDKRYFRLKGVFGNDAATQVHMQLPNMAEVPLTGGNVIVVED